MCRPTSPYAAAWTLPPLPSASSASRGGVRGRLGGDHDAAGMARPRSAHAAARTDPGSHHTAMTPLDGRPSGHAAGGSGGSIFVHDATGRLVLFPPPSPSVLRPSSAARPRSRPATAARRDGTHLDAGKHRTAGSLVASPYARRPSSPLPPQRGASAAWHSGAPAPHAGPPSRGAGGGARTLAGLPASPPTPTSADTLSLSPLLPRLRDRGAGKPAVAGAVAGRPSARGADDSAFVVPALDPTLPSAGSESPWWGSSGVDALAHGGSVLRTPGGSWPVRPMTPGSFSAAAAARTAAWAHTPLKSPTGALIAEITADITAQLHDRIRAAFLEVTGRVGSSLSRPSSPLPARGRPLSGWHVADAAGADDCSVADVAPGDHGQLRPAPTGLGAVEGGSEGV
jgi:hypothetical protein